MKTCRGFELKYFKDVYNTDCSIQESSLADDDCIWLGVHTAKVKVMWSNKDKFNEAHLEKIDPEQGYNCGWYDVVFPEEFLVESRMHLNKKQAKWLIKELQYFIKNGCLKPEEEKE